MKYKFSLEIIFKKDVNDHIINKITNLSKEYSLSFYSILENDNVLYIFFGDNPITSYIHTNRFFLLLRKEYADYFKIVRFHLVNDSFDYVLGEVDSIVNSKKDRISSFMWYIDFDEELIKNDGRNINDFKEDFKKILEEFNVLDYKDNIVYLGASEFAFGEMFGISEYFTHSDSNRFKKYLKELYFISVFEEFEDYLPIIEEHTKTICYDTSFIDGRKFRRYIKLINEIPNVEEVSMNYKRVVIKYEDIFQKDETFKKIKEIFKNDGFDIYEVEDERGDFFKKITYR